MRHPRPARLCGRRHPAPSCGGTALPPWHPVPGPRRWHRLRCGQQGRRGGLPPPRSWPRHNGRSEPPAGGVRRPDGPATRPVPRRRQQHGPAGPRPGSQGLRSAFRRLRGHSSRSLPVHRRGSGLRPAQRAGFPAPAGRPAALPDPVPAGAGCTGTETPGSWGSRPCWCPSGTLR